MAPVPSNYDMIINKYSLNTKKSNITRISYVLGFGIGVGLGVYLGTTLIFKFNEPTFPRPVTITTAPPLSATDRAEIDKDIQFQQAFEKFKVCMTDGNGVSVEECRRRFYAGE